MGLLLNIILAVITLSILYYLIKWIKFRIRLHYYVNKLPGPTGIPIFGMAIYTLGNPERFWKISKEINRDYGPIYRMWFVHHAMVNIFHPDDTEMILSSTKNLGKGAAYDFLLSWFGTGLLTSTGQKWKSRRKLLTKAFHFNILREFSSVLDEEGCRMVTDLSKSNGAVTVDLQSFITKYTLNAICETAMGSSLTKMEHAKDTFQNVYRKAIHDLGYLIFNRIQNFYLHPNLIFNFTSKGKRHNECVETIRGFSKKIIEKRQKFHQETNGVHLKVFDENGDDKNNTNYFQSSKKKLAMLDLLIAEMKNNHIDDEGIWDEVDTFIFEGHDTTAVGISFSILLLAEHPQYQQRAREEVDEILKNTKDGRFTINELQQLPYLERCLKESLRLYPSVPIISRFLSEDIQLKDYLLPAGALTHVHIYDLHRLPEYWPDPERYDPDRFLPENIERRHPFSYVPFSAGPRNCIGQKFAMLELKAILGHLLHNFYFESVDIASKTKMVADLTIRAAEQIRVKFVPRKH